MATCQRVHARAPVEVRVLLHIRCAPSHAVSRPCGCLSMWSGLGWKLATMGVFRRGCLLSVSPGAMCRHALVQACARAWFCSAYAGSP
eukprot:6540617-Alexandrium_andersonii.AAC.1